jgi:hypothetical protein
MDKKFHLLQIVPFLSCLIAFLGLTPLMAQSTQKNDFENSKITYLTQQVKLTPEQSKLFWPIYKEYSTKRVVIKKAIRQSRQRIANENSNEEVVKQMLLAIQQKKQEDLNLENEYLPKFLKVISAQQVASLAKAERTFLTKSIKQLPDNTEVDE